jgi:hypothetical protein
MSAQVGGIAIAPIISEDPANPVYFYIESASDSSFVFSNFSGDFRGNVIISPKLPEVNSFTTNRNLHHTPTTHCGLL